MLSGLHNFCTRARQPFLAASSSAASPLSRSWMSVSPSFTRSRGVFPSRFFLVGSAPCCRGGGGGGGHGGGRISPGPDIWWAALSEAYYGASYSFNTSGPAATHRAENIQSVFSHVKYLDSVQVSGLSGFQKSVVDVGVSHRDVLCKAEDIGEKLKPCRDTSEASAPYPSNSLQKNTGKRLIREAATHCRCRRTSGVGAMSTELLLWQLSRVGSAPWLSSREHTSTRFFDAAS
ncbi:hypothetical protein EYF80_003381 [Liparis tanakae]|uniref:Uncharacterized protein n=1 Tax=Liparis tanakae TaxID=230148 RepID=A0A4Z2J7X7_9TELE|nr:hypothetical protein EYF80_003381 [Liparis tanakae]